METIWVLTCGDAPDSWHEDVFVLLKQIQQIFPEKQWEQINPLVWQMVDGLWKITSINKASESEQEPTP